MDIGQKPSCIKEIKRLTGKLLNTSPVDHSFCLDNIKFIINTDELNDNQKLSKIKQICDSYGERKPK